MRRQQYKMANLSIWLLGLIVSVVFCNVVSAIGIKEQAVLDTIAKSRPSVNYEEIPLSFEVNQGQTDKNVQFISRGQGYGLFLTPTEAVLSLHRAKPAEPKTRKFSEKSLPASAQKMTSNTIQHSPEKAATLRMKLVGGNPNPQVKGLDELPGKVNYFHGKDPEQWQTSVPTYAKVKYKQVYPGIDLIYYGNQRRLEYDFIVAPNADPNVVQLSFEGVEKVAIDTQGNAVLHTIGGVVFLHKPLIYQEINDEKIEIEGHYMLHPAEDSTPQHLSFQVAHYDKNQILVIDPILVYSTYLGGDEGSLWESAMDIAVDDAGNAYVIGQTWSSDFPVVNAAYPEPLGHFDVFITKFDANGQGPVFSTFLGGSSPDEGRGIAVDDAGNIYVTGQTHSSNFPMVNAIYPVLKGAYDAFVAKLDPSGQELIYSTFLGGGGSGGWGFDYGISIAVDGVGNAYVAGHTASPDFPRVNAVFPAPDPAPNYWAWDAFVTKLDPNGQGPIYSTYIGGSDEERATGIAVDAIGNAYITGYTRSNNFPTANALFSTKKGSQDGFIIKLDPDGQGPIYSTYIGGSSQDSISDVAVDTNGNAYLTGYTSSADFPKVNALAIDTDPHRPDAFVLKLSSDGQRIIYSTNLGGSGQDYGEGIALDSLGNAYIIGTTESTNFPIINSIFSALSGNQDAFITKLDPNGQGPIYSTYLGGDNNDRGVAIAVDGNENAYVVGMTLSRDFPILNAVYDTLAGTQDAFVAKISDKTSLSISFTNANCGTSSGASPYPYQTHSVGFLWNYTDDVQFDEVSLGLTAVDGTVMSLEIYEVTSTSENLTNLVARSNNKHIYELGSPRGKFSFSSPVTLLTGHSYIFLLNRESGGQIGLNGSVGCPPLGQGIGAYDEEGNLVQWFDMDFMPYMILGMANPYSITPSSITAPEDVGTITFTVNRTDTSEDETLYVSTVQNQGFTNQNDYVGLLNQPLFFAVDQSTQQVPPIQIIDDAIPEPDETFGLIVQASPTDPIATFLASATFTILDNDTAQPSPVLGIAPTSLDFAPTVVGQTSSPQTVTVTNTGTANLTVGILTLSGDNPADYQLSINTCNSANLAPQATCSFAVAFQPTAVGTRTAGINIPSNDLTSPNKSLALSGTGTDGATEPPPHTQKPYVIFLPGFLGSRLWELDSTGDEQKLWPTGFDSKFIKLRPDEFGNVESKVYTKFLDRVDEGNSGIIDTIAQKEPVFEGYPVYGDFLEFLEQARYRNLISGWEAIPYDWRKSVIDIADTDANNPERGISICDDVRKVCTPHFSVVQRIMDLKAEGIGPVVLIGHSNGGLLAKAVLRELESLPEVGSGNVSSYVKHVLLVASPQLGTPKSVLGLLHGEFIPNVIIGSLAEREVAENTVGAYSLLPSPWLFEKADFNFVEFTYKSTWLRSSNFLLDTFIKEYGEVIGSDDRVGFIEFLLAVRDKRKASISDTQIPNVLSRLLIGSADQLHLWLDNWKPPSKVAVTQVVGIRRAGTVSGIRYFAVGGVLRHEAILAVNSPGDGTVLPSSAAAMDVPTWYVSLDSRCDDHAHMDILNSPRVQKIIKEVLEPQSLYDGDGCTWSSENPRIILGVPTRRVSIWSPATLHLYDEDGRHTGTTPSTDPEYPAGVLVERQIPNSARDVIDGHETIVAEAGKTYRVMVKGTGAGVFTLVSDELLGGGNEIRHIYPSVPTLATTIGTLLLPEEGGSGALLIDFNGDGIDDSSITPSDGFSPASSLHAVNDLVYTFRLPRGITQGLVSKINEAINALAADRVQDAVGALGAFINFVNAQSGKQIPRDVAANLRVIVTQIRETL